MIIFNHYLCDHAGDEFYHALHMLFNLSWQWGRVPQVWRDGDVSAVFKSDDPSNPSNYRPITITSLIMRIFERLVQKKLSCMLYLNTPDSKIKKEQAGFRSRHCCNDHLFQLCTAIGDAHRDASCLAVQFIDIAKAYDTVWINGLMWKLDAIGISRPAWRWLYHFLHGRRIRVVSGNECSDYVDVLSGLPQGSVLSPLLYLIFINDLIPAVLQNNCQCFLFADDIALFPNYVNVRLSNQWVSLQHALDAISMWAVLWKVKFNMTKTAIVPFRLRASHCPIPLPVFILQNQPVCIASSYKYLGVILEDNGKSIQHSNHVITKLNRHRCMISSLYSKSLSRPFYLSPCIAVMLVRCIMMNRITWGMPFWFPHYQHQQHSINTSRLSNSCTFAMPWPYSSL